MLKLKLEFLKRCSFGTGAKLLRQRRIFPGTRTPGESTAPSHGFNS